MSTTMDSYRAATLRAFCSSVVLHWRSLAYLTTVQLTSTGTSTQRSGALPVLSFCCGCGFSSIPSSSCDVKSHKWLELWYGVMKGVMNAVMIWSYERRYEWSYERNYEWNYARSYDMGLGMELRMEFWTELWYGVMIWSYDPHHSEIFRA